MQLRLVDACVLQPLLAECLEVVEGFGVPRDFENVVKAFLERRRLGERPVRVLLVAKEHALDDGGRYAQQQTHFLVQLGAARGDGSALCQCGEEGWRTYRLGVCLDVVHPEDALKCFHGEPAAAFLGDLQVAYAAHAHAVRVAKPQANLGFDRVGMSELGEQARGGGGARARRTTGSYTNAPPLVLGGRSPVAAYLRHSTMVCVRRCGAGKGGNVPSSRCHCGPQ